MVRVLHYSPHNENDGIAKYQEQYIRAMSRDPEIDNKFFETSPLKFRLMDEDEKLQVLQALQKELHDFDILHIQHEFGLFTNDDFKRIADVAKQSGKKVIVTVHLSPEYAIKPVKLGGVGPRSLVSYARQKRHHDHMVEQHVTPFTEADMLIVHNDITAKALEHSGIDKSKIIKLPHPVYEFATPVKKTTTIREKLSHKDGDIIYCTVGMLHKYKGVFDAVRALKFLPKSYKLAILGGMNPFSDEVTIYNKICDLIDQLGLHDRVYITGFVVDDDELNSYIQECDVAVFPYDGSYYGNLSSGSINLALANHMPVIAYPTSGFKELADEASGAVVLCDTYAYYELARELQAINVDKQRELSRSYANKGSWSNAARTLADEYRKLLR